MNKASKIILTVVMIIIFFLLSAFIGELRGHGGRTGVWGLILMLALVGGLRALWKKPQNNQ